MKISINVEGKLFQDVFLCFAPFVAISPVCLVSEYKERGIKKRPQKRVDIELGFELCKPDGSRDIGALVCRGFFYLMQRCSILLRRFLLSFLLHQPIVIVLRLRDWFTGQQISSYQDLYSTYINHHRSINIICWHSEYSSLYPLHSYIGKYFQ